MPQSKIMFGSLLRFWRKSFSLSQEALADSLKSSTRHISRLENGHVHPSYAIIEQIGVVLSMGERDFNHLLVSAGYSAKIELVDFHAPQLNWLRKAMSLTLKAMDPHPAVIIDSAADMLMVNRAWIALSKKMSSQQPLKEYLTYFDWLFHHMVPGDNYSTYQNTLSSMLMSWQQRAIVIGNSHIQEMVDRLKNHPELPHDWKLRAAKLQPRASFRVHLEIDGIRTPFLIVNQTAGAPGPTAYVSEPRLMITTLYVENDNVDLSKIIDQELEHPLLFY